MKKAIVLIATFLLCMATVSAVDLVMTSASGPGSSYDNQYAWEYDYDGASVTVTYDAIGQNFVAHVSATGLKPDFTYQVKLEGPGTQTGDADEFWTNEQIGLNGRWWYSGNRDDAYYQANKASQDITGYMVFDYFTTDASGNAEVDVETDGSYHVLYCDDGAYMSNADLYDYDTSGLPGLKCNPAKYCPGASVNPQIERAGFSQLPEGTFTSVLLALNEESFHQSCGTWTTAMTGMVEFEIDHDYTPPVCGNNDVEGDEECDDGNTDSGDGCSAVCEVEDKDNALVGGGGVIGFVEYAACGDSCTGTVHASGLVPSMEYQLKLSGKPTCVDPDGDDLSNGRLGKAGRFWCTSGCPDGCVIPAWGGGNLDTCLGSHAAAAQWYDDHKNDNDFCAVGYILFDCAYADVEGFMDYDFTVHESYANCASFQRAVTLPDGFYDVEFFVGENFAPSWATIGWQNLRFVIGECEIPEFTAIGAVLAMLGAGLYAYRKRK